MKKHTIRFGCRLTEDDLRKLEEISESEDRSLSSTMRWMISQTYRNMVVNVPIVGTISSKGIKINDTERITT